MRVTERKIKKVVGGGAISPKSVVVRLFGGLEEEVAKRKNFKKVIQHTRIILGRMVRRGDFVRVPLLEGEKDFRYTPRTRASLSEKQRRHNRRVGVR